MRAKGARECRTSLISPKNSTLERPGARALCAPDARGPGCQLFCASLLKLRALCAAAVRLCSEVSFLIEFHGVVAERVKPERERLRGPGDARCDRARFGYN